MKPEELRIGNIVDDHDGFGNMVVESIMSSTGRVYLQTPDKEYMADFSINGITPIELSEDWLMRFGFDVEWTTGGFLKWEKKMAYEEKFKLLDRRLPNPQYHSRNAIIQYVHQLQNLYFALTGEELKLNP